MTTVHGESQWHANSAVTRQPLRLKRVAPAVLIPRTVRNFLTRLNHGLTYGESSSVTSILPVRSLSRSDSRASAVPHFAADAPLKSSDSRRGSLSLPRENSAPRTRCYRREPSTQKSSPTAASIDVDSGVACN
jgi:hypothetical protein